LGRPARAWLGGRAGGRAGGFGRQARGRLQEGGGCGHRKARPGLGTAQEPESRPAEPSHRLAGVSRRRGALAQRAERKHGRL
jgi:hypothetical protein